MPEMFLLKLLLFSRLQHWVQKKYVMLTVFEILTCANPEMTLI